GSLLKMPLT
ncbi:putative regulator of cell, partial [Escherichia coli 89.0511]